MILLEKGYARKKLAGQGLWFLLWLGVTSIGLYLTPDASGHGTHQQLGLPPCPSVLLFDRPCPGCGLTTSWTNLLHGQFAAAFHDHPLGPPLYLLFTISAFIGGIGWLKRERFATDSRLFNQIVGVTVTIFVTFGVIRMATTPHFGTPAEHWIRAVTVK